MIGTYGHGTENDFVLLFDPENQNELSAEQVARICNRESGIGSDGFIRIGKINNRWFMDYRNNDGSLAEMCGNGIRVMGRYLIERGYQGEGIVPVETRDGTKYLNVPKDADISVNMGGIEVLSSDIQVESNGKKWEGGYNVNVGNPHAVVFIEDINDAGDLKSAPVVNPKSQFPDGVNVEFVEFTENGELKMRVHERGVGETRSCGTGICAVAMAATLKTGKKLPAKWVINPPGGRLEVEIDAHSNAILTGPAVLIRDCELDSYL